MFLNTGILAVLVVAVIYLVTGMTYIRSCMVSKDVYKRQICMCVVFTDLGSVLRPDREDYPSADLQSADDDSARSGNCSYGVSGGRTSCGSVCNSFWYP